MYERASWASSSGVVLATDRAAGPVYTVEFSGGWCLTAEAAFCPRVLPRAYGPCASVWSQTKPPTLLVYYEPLPSARTRECLRQERGQAACPSARAPWSKPLSVPRRRRRRCLDRVCRGMRDGRWVPPERILPLAPLTLLLAELKGFLSTRGQGACGELLFWSPLRARTRTHAHTQTHKHSNKHTTHTLHLDALTWTVQLFSPACAHGHRSRRVSRTPALSPRPE